MNKLTTPALADLWHDCWTTMWLRLGTAEVSRAYAEGAYTSCTNWAEIKAVVL